MKRGQKHLKLSSYANTKHHIHRKKELTTTKQEWNAATHQCEKTKFEILLKYSKTRKHHRKIHNTRDRGRRERDT